MNGVPWAHLDIAGMGFGSPQSEINRGWASGWGVRLLDRLVKDSLRELGVGPAHLEHRQTRMTEILFYHLQNQPLEVVLPALLTKSLERGWRAVIQVTTEERLSALDDTLWTYSDESFLPHGTDREAHAADQPVLITLGEGNPNGAASGRRGHGGEGLADAARSGLRQDDRVEIRRHEERGRPPRRIEHRRGPAPALRERRALQTIDIAGIGFGSPQSEINRGWASGWGVRLLDRLVKDSYES